MNNTERLAELDFIGARMFYTTETRNQKVYLTMSGFDSFEPRIITSFFLTDGNPEIIPNGTRFDKFVDSYIARVYGREISIRITAELPEFTEFTPVKKPRGRYTWRWGEWVKG